MLVYDISQEQTFANVTKWMRNIEEVKGGIHLLCINVCF